MRFLLIDAGNTLIKSIFYELSNDNFTQKNTSEYNTSKQLEQDWQTNVLEFGMPSKILVANVCGERAQQFLETLFFRVFPGVLTEWVQASSEKLGLTNHYLHPEKLGIDRFVGALGAHHYYPHENLLLVSLGTATTIDFIDVNGNFRGGVILPGWSLMLSSLAQATAQLPKLDADIISLETHPVDTMSAILLGCQTAQICAIMTRWQLVPSPKRCILTGGMASKLAPALPITNLVIDDSIIFKGLKLLAITFAQSGD